jgi:hypothetical protein
VFVFGSYTCDLGTSAAQVSGRIQAGENERFHESEHVRHVA